MAGSIESNACRKPLSLIVWALWLRFTLSPGWLEERAGSSPLTSCAPGAIQTFSGEHETGSCFQNGNLLQQRISTPSSPWTCLNPRQFVKRHPFVLVKLSNLYIKTKCCYKAETYCLGTLQKEALDGREKQSTSCTAWLPQLPPAPCPCVRRMVMVVAAHLSSAHVKKLQMTQQHPQRSRGSSCSTKSCSCARAQSPLPQRL